jgi:drug/metabolite transporter (DMT)-like permease
MPSTPINRAMTSTEWTMLVALSILWGGSFFFVGVALKELPPLTIVLARVGLSALILNILVVALGAGMPRAPRIWAAFFAMGFFNNVAPFSLIVWGQMHIASGLAAILNATTPLWTVVVANFLTPDEKMTSKRLAGVILGIIGVAVMIGPTAVDGLGGNLLAEFAVLLGALSYAFAGVFGRRFARMGVTPLQIAGGQTTASTLILAPLVLIVEPPWTLAAPGAATWAAIVGIAVLSTALGYVLYFRILATAGATNLLLVTFLIPVSANLLGCFVLGERLDPRHYVGMALIAFGLAAIDGRLLDWASAASPRRAKPERG